MTGVAESVLGSKQLGDAVAQSGVVKRLRIIRVKHFQAGTGDELAAMVGGWFRAKKETTSDDLGNFVSEKDLSEQRELVEWRYQVTTASVTVPADDGTTTTTSGEIHHIMLLYAE